MIEAKIIWREGLQTIAIKEKLKALTILVACAMKLDVVRMLVAGIEVDTEVSLIVEVQVGLQVGVEMLI